MKRRGNWINCGVGAVLRRLDIYDDVEWEESSSSSSSTINDSGHNHSPTITTPVSIERDTLCAAAPQGGPICFVNTDTSTLDIYTANGRKINQLFLPPEVRNSIHEVGWSADEAPLVVSTGSNNHPPMFLVGDLAKKSFDKFKCAEPTRVISGNPVAGIVRSFGCYYIYSTSEDEPSASLVLNSLLLPDNLFDPIAQYSHNLSDHLCGVTAIEAVAKSDLDSKVALLYICGYSARESNLRPSQRTPGIFTIDCETGDFEQREIRLPEDTYVTQIAICPESQRFALMFQNGTMWITKADLNEAEMQLNLGVTAPTTRFQWCGNRFLHLMFDADKFQEHQQLNGGGHHHANTNNNNDGKKKTKNRSNQNSDNDDEHNNNSNNNSDDEFNNNNEDEDEEEYIFPCQWSLLVSVPTEEIYVKQLNLQSPALAGMLPQSELIKWDLESPSGYVMTTTEIDGLRVVSETSNILFECVPSCLESACHLRAGTVASCLCRAIQDLHDAGISLLDSAVKLDHLLNGKTIDALNSIGLLPGANGSNFDNGTQDEATKKKNASSSSKKNAAGAASSNQNAAQQQKLTGNAVPGAATSLVDVLEELLDAACSEYDPEGQAAFLRIVSEMTLLLSRNRYATAAITNSDGDQQQQSSSYMASYNKYISNSISYTGIEPDIMKEVARRLRMLNDLRSRHGVGMPMTLRQYQYLTGNYDRSMLTSEARPVINRLIHHRDFLHASRFAYYFGSKLETIALQWAITKVQDNGNHEGRNAETHRILTKVLKHFPTVDNVDVANAAVTTGNRSLAVDLLQSDNNSASEVLLLLQLDYPDLAVEKALGSDDTELVAEILLKLMTEYPKAQLHAALMRYPDPSQNIFLTVCENLGQREEDVCREFCEHARIDVDFAFRIVLTKAFRQALKDNIYMISNLKIDKMDSITAYENKTLTITVEKKLDEEALAAKRKEKAAMRKKDKKQQQQKSSGKDKKKKSSGNEWSSDDDDKKHEKKSADNNTDTDNDDHLFNSNNDDDDDSDAYAEEDITVDYNPDIELREFTPFNPKSDPPIIRCSMELTAELQALSARVGDEATSKGFTQHMYLQTQQEKLAAEHDDDPDVVGMPVSQTLRWMYKNGEDAAAEELCGKLGVSERAHILAKLDAWSEVGRWDMLDHVAGISPGGGKGAASSKSSSNKDMPSGCLISFIETAHKAGQQERAVLLASKLSSIGEKVEWFVQLDEFQRAADVCYSEGSLGMLQQLRRKSQNPQMQRYIEERIKKLS